MTIRDFRENIILVDLPQEHQSRTELENVIESVRNKGGCDVVIDFSNVDIITSATICGLLKLRQLQADSGHKLALCNVVAQTKSIFEKTGLGTSFDFVDDTSAALADMQVKS